MWLQRGLASAVSAGSKAAAAAMSEMATALNSTRAGLSQEPVEAEQAAELLQTAEGLLKAQPRSHTARCSFTEVCCLPGNAGTRALCKCTLLMVELCLVMYVSSCHRIVLSKNERH